MKTWYVVAIGVFALVLAAVANISYAYEEVSFTVEDEIETPEPAVEQGNGVTDQDRFIAEDEFFGSHLVLVSTMDGKITALDVNAGGEVAWSVDADAMPLVSGTFSTHQKMQGAELPYTLVPSLDGSLFMLEIEKGLLHPVPLTADISRMVDDVAVTGGSLSTKTGVDPITGEVKYRCTSGKCEQRVQTSTSSRTLVITRSTQIARAADPLTGSEKWNLSVGEYMVQLFETDGSAQNLYTKIPTHYNFRLKPPDGVVSAYICGHMLWERYLRSPIARIWQLADGQLEEISLFDSNNVEALSNFGQGCEGSARLPRFETPFYLGFFNSEPYIIPSEKVRAQKHFSQFPSYSPELIHHGHLFLNDLVGADVFKRKYRAHVREITMSTEAPKRITYVENCPADEAVLVPGSREVECADCFRSRTDDEIYGGWYIFTPIINPQHMLVDGSQPKNNVRGTSNEQCAAKAGIVKKIGEKLKVTELVSGWWRLGAIALVFVSCSAGFVIAVKFRQVKNNFELRARLLRGLNSFYKLPSLKLPKRMNSSIFVSSKPAAETATPTGSSATMTPQFTPTDPFVSKFLEDFVPEKCLGRGGYGVVFSCRHRLDDRNYAVKRITVSNTISAIDRVKREAKAMATLNHPGIIRYFHTWIEKPPLGWQQAMDKQIHAQMRTVAGATGNSFAQISKEQSKSSVYPNEKGDSIEPFACKKIAPLVEKSLPHDVEVDRANTSASASVSWAVPESSTQDSESSSSSESGWSLGQDIVAACPVETPDSETSSVVFADEMGSVKRERSDAKKSSSEPLEPPLVLVADVTDLQTCKRTKDYIYLYIQMELCQELTLHNWLFNNRKKEDREVSQMRNWFAQIVCAVDYIHEKGLIHRDIKPQNIFFSADGHNTLKIGDLGLATNFDVVEENSKTSQPAHLNRHTGNVGTRLYMSPEQLKGQPYNQKVDVFSLGLIFAEMLIPFQTVMERHESLTALQKAILPERHLKNFPKEREFIQWLTAEDPERRPTSSEVMLCDYLSEEVHSVISQFRPDHTRASSNNNRLLSLSKANA